MREKYGVMYRRPEEKQPLEAECNFNYGTGRGEGSGVKDIFTRKGMRACSEYKNIDENKFRRTVLGRGMTCVHSGEGKKISVDFMKKKD